MEDLHNTSWESTYEALLTQPYQDVLDTEFETEKYYELPWIIEYFNQKGEKDKVLFLIDLEKKIENENGRKLSIGDKFVLDSETVKCELEIMDFDENNSASIEFSKIEYKTNKKEIPQNIDITLLDRTRWIV